MMSLIGHVVLLLLLSIMLLMMQMVILLMVRMRRRRWCFARRRVRQRPDFRFRRRDRYAARAAIRFDTLLLQMILTAVTLMVMVMMLHRMMEGMLAPSAIVLEIQIVLFIKILLVL